MIDGNRILTNAHVVEMASQIFVQPPNSADKIRAVVIGIAQGIDLAVIELRLESDRESFHADHPPLTLNEALPAIGSTVQAIGFPMGGEQISLTGRRGSHESSSLGIPKTPLGCVSKSTPRSIMATLVVQSSKMIRSSAWSSRVSNPQTTSGTFIPVQEVVAFLNDIDDDGEYNGRPKTFAKSFQTTENPALRDWLDLDTDQTGILYTGDGSEDESVIFEQWDLIDQVGEHDVDNAGMITNRRQPPFELGLHDPATRKRRYRSCHGSP